MAKIKEHDPVVLKRDIPGHQLKAGDMGVIVHLHAATGPFEVEFIAASGETLAVCTLTREDLRPIDPIQDMQASFPDSWVKE